MTNEKCPLRRDEFCVSLKDHSCIFGSSIIFSILLDGGGVVSFGPILGESLELPELVAFAASDTAHHKEFCCIWFPLQGNKTKQNKSLHLSRNAAQESLNNGPQTQLSCSWKNYLSFTRKRVPQTQERQLFFLDKAALPGMRGIFIIQVDGQVTLQTHRLVKGRGAVRAPLENGFT